jgi:hypothetical protein
VVIGHHLHGAVAGEPADRLGGEFATALDCRGTIVAQGRVGFDVEDDCGPVGIGVVCDLGRGELDQGVGPTPLE